MDAVEEMFAMPADTAEGRRAKVTVLLSCILPENWRHQHAKTDYPARMAVLLGFMGGGAWRNASGQFT